MLAIYQARNKLMQGFVRSKIKATVGRGGGLLDKVKDELYFKILLTSSVWRIYREEDTQRKAVCGLLLLVVKVGNWNCYFYNDCLDVIIIMCA